MPSAATNIRGACLNCRLAVNGIQNARRSFGARLVRCDIAASPDLPRGIFSTGAENSCFMTKRSKSDATTPRGCVKRISETRGRSAMSSRMTRAAARQNPTRIQREKTEAILAAALDVFSSHGFRGATLDQIAEAAGLSKPNLLY